MNKDWHRWIWASLGVHFKTLLEAENLKMPGSPSTNIPDSANRFEVRTIGPDYEQMPGNEFDVTIVINLAIVTALDPSDITKHQARVGLGLTCFPFCIPVKKYGQYETDSKEYITAFQIQTEIKTTDLVPYDPVSNTTRSTIEATYLARF